MKKYKWDKKYIYIGVTAFLVIACSIVFYLLVGKWAAVRTMLAKIEYILSPIIIGLVVAYLLRPGMNFLERKFYMPLSKKIFKDNTKKVFILSRILGMVSVLVLMLVVLIGIVILVVPQLYQSIEKLVFNMNDYIDLVKKWTNEYLAKNPNIESTLQNVFSNGLSYIANWLQTGVMNRANSILVNITSGFINVIMALVHFLIGIVVSVYVLYSKEKFGAQIKKIIYCLLKPKTANGILEIIRKSDEMFSGFFIGKVLDSAIIGVLCAIFMFAANMPYAALISVIIGVTNIIPFFGPYIGAVPSAFLILLESPVKCFIFVVFILILQTFDGNILGPKILGNKTNLTSFWVIFAILVGGGFFGFFGMICGVPVLAVIYYFCQRGVRRRLKAKKLPLDDETYMNIDTVDEKTNKPILKNRVADLEENSSESNEPESNE